MSPATRELRTFGLGVGSVFAVLGTVSWLRGHALPPRILWTLGAALAVPGLLAPALLRPVERVWMRGALVLGYVNTRIILTAVFYLVVTPIGWVMRRFRDPLSRALTARDGTCWIRREARPTTRERYERQF